MESLYRQKVMRHFSSPQNHGRLKKTTKIFNGANPLCGDEMTIYVKVGKEDKIAEVKWDGQGCAISQASASIFSEMIKGKTLLQARNIKADKLVNELEVELSPTRLKCALLPLFTIKEENID